MRSTIVMLAAALALAGCSMMPSFGSGDAQSPSAAAAPQVAPMSAPAAVQVADAYEIEHVVRGPVRRVKVRLNGRTIETLTMSRGRTAATSHCCTQDGCTTIDKKAKVATACTTFKMTCDQKGACTRDDANKSSSKI